MDGSDPMQMTNSNQAKFDLQWLPGGKEILYGEGRCINTVNIDTLEKSRIACFDGPYFEGFRVSPDGKQVAISIERRVVVVPFDREALSTANSAFDLQNMNACLDYADVSAKGAQWSADGKKLAVLYQSVKGQRLADTIRVIDIHRCRDADPLILDEFPARRFTPQGYETYPVLPSYNWDGDQRFLFNTFKRNQGYGELYLYDMFTNEWRLLNPVDNVCCYRDARFSPDGKYVLFVFQDVRLGAEGDTQLYYIPLDEIGTGAKFKPIRLPPLFFPNPRVEILPDLHPSIP
jgi:Tol biopolymer transport system component